MLLKYINQINFRYFGRFTASYYKSNARIFRKFKFTAAAEKTSVRAQFSLILMTDVILYYHPYIPTVNHELSY